MSREAMKFINRLRKILMPPDVTVDGEVVSIDEDEYTCTVRLANGLELDRVQLKALKGKTKTFVLIPAVGSAVQVVNVGAPDWMVISCDELDKIIADVAVKIELNAPETVFNNGNNGGLPISGKVAERLNKLEQDINKLKQALSTWVPVAQDGGAALKTAAGTWFGQQLQETQPEQIENDKIKH